MRNLPSVDTLRSLFYIEESKLYWRVDPPYKSGFIGKEVGTLNKGYREVKLGQTRYRVHRIMYALYHGEDPGTSYIDHVDGDRLNNSKENLRLASKKQNRHNVKDTGRNKLGYQGVRQRGNRFSASIRVNGKPISLGQYDSPEQAHEVYKEAHVRHFGDYSPYASS